MRTSWPRVREIFWLAAPRGFRPIRTLFTTVHGPMVPPANGAVGDGGGGVGRGVSVGARVAVGVEVEVLVGVSVGVSVGTRVGVSVCVAGGGGVLVAREAAGTRIPPRRAAVASPRKNAVTNTMSVRHTPRRNAATTGARITYRMARGIIDTLARFCQRRDSPLI